MSKRHGCRTRDGLIFRWKPRYCDRDGYDIDAFGVEITILVQKVLLISVQPPKEQHFRQSYETTSVVGLHLNWKNC